MSKYLVVYREHGQLNCQTRFFGPFEQPWDAQEFLATLPAIGIYDHVHHAGMPGCKYIERLEEDFA